MGQAWYITGWYISISMGKVIGELKGVSGLLGKVSACSLPKMSTWSGIRCKVQVLWAAKTVIWKLPFRIACRYLKLYNRNQKLFRH
ncbi:hypothetical protein TNCV_2189951 [Trichonephila clavipes]|nr:hypothetical protein TNCV_2189951 [Trichonephila clavipes]